MIINKQNEDAINDIYVHDSYLDDMYFSYEKKVLDFSVVNYYTNTKVFFKFNNVFYYEITACDLWGASNRINGMGIEEVNSCILSNIKASPKQRIKKADELINIVFEMVSGDLMSITCQYVELFEDTSCDLHKDNDL